MIHHIDIATKLLKWLVLVVIILPETCIEENIIFIHQNLCFKTVIITFIMREGTTFVVNLDLWVLLKLQQ